jgi:type IV secretion system protein VirB4
MPNRLSSFTNALTALCATGLNTTLKSPLAPEKSRRQTIRAYVTEALKTWRKKNACVLLATQSSEDLQRSELLRVVIESCPTKCFLSNPHIDRAVYRELFHLNETESEAIATLIPRQQFLFKQPAVAKVLNLHVDAESAALFGAARRH